MDWGSLFIPTIPLLELLLRGTLIYLGLFFLLRVVLKREAGEVGIADLLVIVLIADAAQNGLSGGYRSITEGLLLVAVIIFWSYFLEWLGYHVPALNRLLQSPPLLLVENGSLLVRNLRKELLTREDVMQEIRAAGLEDLAQVERMYLEGNGQFSIIPREAGSGSGEKKPRS